MVIMGIGNAGITIREATRNPVHRATENAIDTTIHDALIHAAYEAVRAVAARSGANATENAVDAATAAVRHPLST